MLWFGYYKHVDLSVSALEALLQQCLSPDDNEDLAVVAEWTKLWSTHLAGDLKALSNAQVSWNMAPALGYFSRYVVRHSVDLVVICGHWERSGAVRPPQC